MKITSNTFRVRGGKKVNLSKWPTFVKSFRKSKKQYQELLAKHIEKLSSLQHLHYASHRYALLLMFQGIDSAGKDGAIRHVMSGVNPQGCQVFSFKQPSAEELEHDFLWRTTRCLPERGRIGIFNRSYYEEVLVVRVHPEILRNHGLSEELRDENNIWEERYRSIVDLENHLYRNGTRILKFFLHLSKDEQRKRFLERIDEPDKNWKFSLADIHERKYWKDYVHAYEECLNATSTHHAPWLRGSHITMEQTRVDGGIWMPERVEVRAAAKIFFVKSLVIDRILTYSEYRLPEAGMAATGASVIP